MKKLSTKVKSKRSRYSLLSVEADAKTSKGAEYGYLTGILYLAPGKEADGKHNLCTFASKECLKACLYGSGMGGVFPSVKEARVNKTLQYFADPAGFMERLASDVPKLEREAKSRGLKPAVRINGTSDVPKLALELAARFPTVQFYDYTKIPEPWRRSTANYHLTFSFSGTNMAACVEALAHNVNVTVVFALPRKNSVLPAMWNGYRVIDGDKHDLRFLDAQGVIVGLRVKPNKNTRAMKPGGFIQIAIAA